MITLDLTRLLESRGITNAMAFLIRNGIPRNTTKRMLENEHASITFENMEKLCLLLDCTPDEIFHWTPPKASPNAKTVALAKLNRSSRGINIVKKVKELPLDKQEIVRDFLLQLEKKGTESSS